MFGRMGLGRLGTLNPPAPRGGAALLQGETGLGIDFTDSSGVGSVAVIGHSTNYNNVPVDGFLTQSGTSPKLVRNASGTYVWSPHNLVLRSEAIDHAAWSKSSVTAVADQANDSTGAATLEKITEVAATAVHYVGSTAIAVIAGASYTTTFEARAGDLGFVQISFPAGTFGTTYANFDLNNGAVGSKSAAVTANIVSLGGGLYRCEASITCGTSGNADTIIVLIPAADSARSLSYLGTGKFIYVGRVRVNRGTVTTTYLATTSAAKFAVPMDYDSGWAMLVEPAATNLCLRAQDFSNASWTKSNLTAARTATGIDGVANSASTLTATAGNATALQAITSGSSSRLTSMFVKRRTGSGAVEMTQDNGSTWTPITVTADWARVEIAAVTSTNPTVGVRIVTSGDAVDVDIFQHETGSVATSPIETFSATVTRAADNINVATSALPYSATAGTVLINAVPYQVSTAQQLLSISDGTANERIQLYEFAPAVKAWMSDGGATQVNALAAGSNGNAVAGALFRVGLAWSADDVALVKDAGTAGTDATATLPTPTIMYIGNRYDGAGGNQIWNGRIHSLIYLPRRMTNADLQARTT